MKFTKDWDNTGVHFSITLFFVISLIMLGTTFFAVSDPTWALVSGVVCTELEIDQARSVVLLRILGTVIGAGIACLALFFLDPGYTCVIVSVIVSTLICHYIIPIKNGWKLATATAVMISVAGIQQHSVYFAEVIAIKRALEVLGGSIAAGIVSVLLSRFWPTHK